MYFSLENRKNRRLALPALALALLLGGEGVAGCADVATTPKSNVHPRAVSSSTIKTPLIRGNRIQKVEIFSNGGAVVLSHTEGAVSISMQPPSNYGLPYDTEHRDDYTCNGKDLRWLSYQKNSETLTAVENSEACDDGTIVPKEFMEHLLENAGDTFGPSTIK